MPRVQRRDHAPGASPARARSAPATPASRARRRTNAPPGAPAGTRGTAPTAAAPRPARAAPARRRAAPTRARVPAATAAARRARSRPAAGRPGPDGAAPHGHFVRARPAARTAGRGPGAIRSAVPAATRTRRRGCAPRPCWQHVRLARPHPGSRDLAAAARPAGHRRPEAHAPPARGDGARGPAPAHPHRRRRRAEDAVQRLRNRGWTVDVVPSPSPACSTRVRQHAQRRPSPLLHGLAARFARARGRTPRWSSTSTRRARTTQRRPGFRPSSACTTSTAPRPRSAAEHLSGIAWLQRGQPRRRAAHGRAPRRSRAPTASCASPRPTPPSCARSAGAPCSPPTASTTSSSPSTRPGDEDRALFFGHFGYEANRRGVARFLAEGWPEVRRARPNARLALAGAGSDAPGWRRDGVDILGLVADLPAVRRRRPRGDRPDLGGRRHAAEGARGAGRGARGGVDAARRVRRSASSTSATGCWRRRPRRWRPHSRVCWANPRPTVETAGFWLNVSGGKRRFQARRRSTRK